MSEPVVQLQVDELRRVFELLMAHITKSGDGRLATSRDYFWSIPAPDRYDVYKEPNEFTIGQVSEAWENLRGMLEGRSEALGYGLVWLADVLRAIGDEEVG
jgi:hypothetical protein